MKKSATVFIVSILSFGCTEKANNESASETNKLETVKETGNIKLPSQKTADSLRYEYQNYRTVKLSDPIYEDFDGDSKVDTAVFTIRNQKSGVLIISGKSGKEYLIGGGNTFRGMDDDFSWVDTWGVINDKETFEVLIENAEIVGERKVILDNPSVFMMKQEVGGGIITYKNGRFIWVHQSD